MPDIPAGWVRMDHPDTAGTAVVTQKAYDEIWAAKGWVNIGAGDPVSEVWVDASMIAAVATGELTENDVGGQLSQIAAILESRLQSGPEFLADYVVVWDDFLGEGLTSGLIGSLGWTLSLTATGLVAVPAADLGAPGVLTMQASAVADAASIGLNLYSIIGSPEFTLEWRAKVNNLNGGGQESTYKWGTMDAGGLTPNNGHWFEYSAALGANWVAKSRGAAGATTQTDTGVPVVADWTRLRIQSDGDGVVYFVIDDSVEATHSVGIPTTEPHAPRAHTIKTLGAASRNARNDYFYLKLARP